MGHPSDMIIMPVRSNNEANVSWVHTDFIKILKRDWLASSGIYAGIDYNPIVCAQMNDRALAITRTENGHFDF